GGRRQRSPAAGHIPGENRRTAQRGGEGI
ncbi:uncharacterized protein METZ01_LOCUS226073, partial [marine metagenome]